MNTYTIYFKDGRVRVACAHFALNRDEAIRFVGALPFEVAAVR